MRALHLSNVELRALGWQVLVKHLGHAGALRYAMLTESGVGDYAEQRHRDLGKLSVDELVEKMRQHRAASRSSRRQPRRKRA